MLTKDFIKEKKEFENQINDLISSFKEKHPYANLTEGGTYKMRCEVDAIELFKQNRKTHSEVQDQ
jgi:hypothetical protein